MDTGPICMELLLAHVRSVNLYFAENIFFARKLWDSELTFKRLL